MIPRNRFTVFFVRLIRRLIWAINGPPETFCGAGSTVANTGPMRGMLEAVIRLREIRSILDLGCGDWNWLRLVDLDGVEYTGIDSDAGFIDDLQDRYGMAGRRFIAGYVLGTVWWKRSYDLVICRDLFIHLDNDAIEFVLQQMRKCGAGWLMATTYPEVEENRWLTKGERRTGYDRYVRASRPVNLCLPPFSLPPPILTVKEPENTACAGRLVGLWKLNGGT